MIVPLTIEDFTIPGQYVKIRQPGAEKAGVFAIASAPGKAGAFEFLIKEQPPSDWSPGTGWLTSAPAGTELEMSQVMGPGFKCTGNALDGVTDVLLFAVGSGISPVRSVIESRALQGKHVSLYFGARTPLAMAYTDKFAEWERMGVKVTPVISQPSGTGWHGATGYVQDVARAAGVPNPSSTLMLICGVKGMMEGVKALAAEVGVPKENVRANF
jgi:NAD(P)H-flavin reductase